MIQGINETVVSITLYGTFEKNFNWLDWLNYCEKKFLEYNYEPNYIGFRSETVKINKVLQLKRKNNINKILNAINNNEKIEFLTIYSLPKNFRQAVFDYNMYIRRNDKCIEMVMEKDLCLNLNINELIDDLKSFIVLDKGEVFEISRKECPFSYSGRWNDISFYKTLKILHTF